MSKALSRNFRIQDTLEAAYHIEGGITASIITGQPINTRASTRQPSELLNPDSDNTKCYEDAESQFSQLRTSELRLVPCNRLD